MGKTTHCRQRWFGRRLEVRKEECDKLADAISLLTRELCEMREQRRAENETNKILHRIEKKVEDLMANQAQLVTDLKAVSDQQKKTAGEIATLQTGVDTLKAQIVDLEAVIAAGVQPSQELVDAVAEVKAQAQIVDDLIPDVIVPPPPTL